MDCLCGTRMNAFPIMAPLPPGSDRNARSAKLESIIYHCPWCGNQVDVPAKKKEAKDAG